MEHKSKKELSVKKSENLLLSAEKHKVCPVSIKKTKFSRKFFGRHWLVMNRDSEFRFLYKKGNSVAVPMFVCYFKENRQRLNRVAFVSSKKIGNAVIRNRARRLIREGWRLFEPELKASFTKSDFKRFNLIFLAREATAKGKSSKVLYDMRTRLLPVLTGKVPPQYRNAEKNSVNHVNQDNSSVKNPFSSKKNQKHSGNKRGGSFSAGKSADEKGES